MSFVIYDLVFFALFVLITVLFLYKKRQNLQRQGLMYLYRTKIGLEIIEWTANRFKKHLKLIEYIVITSGFVLMVVMIYFLGKFSYVYLTSPTIAETLKVPVIVPLVPYLPELAGLDFLPPFYFTYWIIIIAIIAIPHEFAHGIFARLNKIRVHATGFGFLGPFIAAFVEPDEKQMNRAKKVPQMAILAAGTFANVLTTLVFLAILWIFFILAFVPAGVHFTTYATSVFNTSELTAVNGTPIALFDTSVLNLSAEYVDITVNDKMVYISPAVLAKTLDNNVPYIMAFEDAPAFNARLAGAIVSIDQTPVTTPEELRSAIQATRPGQTVAIETVDDGERRTYQIVMSEKNGRSYLGIGSNVIQTTGLSGKLYAVITTIKDPLIFYESRIGELGTFFYDLLWWIVLICISVALVNMLPMGMFDGGRFFMLAVWGITGSQKVGMLAYKTATYIILGLVAALMVKWIFAIL